MVHDGAEGHGRACRRRSLAPFPSTAESYTTVGLLCLRVWGTLVMEQTGVTFERHEVPSATSF